MLEVIRGFVMAVLGGGLAEQHGLLVQEDVSPARSYPEP